MTTSKKMEDDLKKRKKKKKEDDLKMKKRKKIDNQKKNGKRIKQKWKSNQSTKINLIGCDTIVNSPSLGYIAKTINDNHLIFA